MKNLYFSSVCGPSQTPWSFTCTLWLICILLACFNSKSEMSGRSYVSRMQVTALWCLKTMYEQSRHPVAESAAGGPPRPQALPAQARGSPSGSYPPQCTLSHAAVMIPTRIWAPCWAGTWLFCPWSSEPSSSQTQPREQPHREKRAHPRLSRRENAEPLRSKRSLFLTSFISNVWYTIDLSGYWRKPKQ